MALAAGEFEPFTESDFDLCVMMQTHINIVAQVAKILGIIRRGKPEDANEANTWLREVNKAIVDLDSTLLRRLTSQEQDTIFDMDLDIDPTDDTPEEAVDVDVKRWARFQLLMAETRSVTPTSKRDHLPSLAMLDEYFTLVPDAAFGNDIHSSRRTLMLTVGGTGNIQFILRMIGKLQTNLDEGTVGLDVPLILEGAIRNRHYNMAVYLVGYIKGKDEDFAGLMSTLFREYVRAELQMFVVDFDNAYHLLELMRNR
jgi:hypothetical protein